MLVARTSAGTATLAINSGVRRPLSAVRQCFVCIYSATLARRPAFPKMTVTCNIVNAVRKATTSLTDSCP